MFQDKAKLIENYSYFCSINVLIFSHKLTLKTVDIVYKYIRMSLKSYTQFYIFIGTAF